ncbi:MAG TPA: hypothetical protein VMW56_04875 [Candidatus Margulisiibacteriota bacterium]|nr:hypothetical protein [Candidatus Margulisiibacteriota bacterium]
MKNWVVGLIGYATCRFCGRTGRPARFVGGACDNCARENLKWVNDIGGVLTVPRGVRLPHL